MGYNMEEDMNVLKKINKIRLEHGWSIYRLSVESGISQSTLTNMFNRETLPSITTLECLCNAFGITMSDFFKEEYNEKQKSDLDHELLNLFSKLSDEEKNSAIVLFRSIAKNK